MADALPRIGDVAGPQPGHDRRGIAHADPAADMAALAARARCGGRRPVARPRRARHPDHGVLRGRVHDRAPAGRAPDRDPAPGAVGQLRLGVPGARSAGVGLPIAGVAAVIGQTGSAEDGGFDDVRVGGHRGRRQPYRATAVEEALRGTTSARRRSPPRPSASATASTSRATSTPIAQYRAAMAVVMARRALELARERLGLGRCVVDRWVGRFIRIRCSTDGSGSVLRRRRDGAERSRRSPGPASVLSPQRARGARARPLRIDSDWRSGAAAGP